jgi:hypothetical protein
LGDEQVSQSEALRSSRSNGRATPRVESSDCAHRQPSRRSMTTPRPSAAPHRYMTSLKAVSNLLDEEMHRQDSDLRSERAGLSSTHVHRLGTLDDRTDLAVDSRMPAAAEETAQLLAK